MSTGDLVVYEARTVKRLIAEAVAAERERILVPDETLNADGSIGPDAVPPGLSPDPAYWYRRWLFALKQLDALGTEHMFASAMAARAAIAERERIRQLAAEHKAHVWVRRMSSDDPSQPYYAEEPFADLIGGDT
jgi:hypothetical protein